MAATSLSLGTHWEGFIRKQVESGRYASASEVIRDALRSMEERDNKLDMLRAHLDEGRQQALRGDFVKGFSIDELIADLNQEAE